MLKIEKPDNFLTYTHYSLVVDDINPVLQERLPEGSNVDLDNINVYVHKYFSLHHAQRHLMFQRKIDGRADSWQMNSKRRLAFLFKILLEIHYS